MTQVQASYTPTKNNVKRVTNGTTPNAYSGPWEYAIIRSPARTSFYVQINTCSERTYFHTAHWSGNVAVVSKSLGGLINLRICGANLEKGSNNLNKSVWKCTSSIWLYCYYNCLRYNAYGILVGKWNTLGEIFMGHDTWCKPKIVQ